MFKLSHILFTIIIFFTSLYLNAEKFTEIPSLDELKRMHMEGTNGYLNIDKLNSIFASGRILYYTNNDTIERTFRVYKKKPNKYRSFYETKLANKTVQLEVIYDGEDAMQLFSHGGREVYREKLQGDALEAVKFESSLNGPFLLVMEENKQYLSIEGYQNIEGEKCILLSVDERSQYPYRNIWLSVENLQEIKFDRIVEVDGVEKLEEVYFRSFKNMQGIWFASRTDKFIDGKRNFTTFIDDFNLNYGLFDSLFDLDSN